MIINQFTLDKIKQNRKRVIDYYLYTMSKHYKSDKAIIKLDDGRKVSVTLSHDNLSQLLIKHVELPIMEKFGADNGSKKILDLYQSMISNKGDKLSPDGFHIMNEIIADTVDSFINQQVNDE